MKLVITVILLLIPNIALAQPALLPPCIHSGNCGICDIVDIIGNVTQWMFYILGGALLIVIIAGIGWFWILRQMGDADKIQEGKEVLKGCMWGALFVLIAWQLVNLVLFGFGTQVGSPLYDKTTAGEKVGRQTTFKLFGNPWNYICDPNFGDLKKLAGTTAVGYNQAVCFSRGDGTPCDYAVGDDKDDKITKRIVYGGICLQGVCDQNLGSYANACHYLEQTYGEYFGQEGVRAGLDSYSCLTKEEVKEKNQDLKNNSKKSKNFYDCLSDTNLCPNDIGDKDQYCCGEVQGEGEPYSN